MFGKQLVTNMIQRSAENAEDRRRFLLSAGALGLGVVGASVLPAGVASAETTSGPSDGAVLNFALNLEYLEAEFYSHAVHGYGLTDSLTGGTGRKGGVTGGRKVPFKTRRIRQYAQEIAGDELHHVKFLRTALGSAAVSRPSIDLRSSFTAAARAAKVIGSHDTFDPYANENNFLLAAFLFEDVGVTAYKGAAPLITNKTYLEAAAGILSVEAYHAATIRSALYEKGLSSTVAKLSAARDSLDGASDDDQGITLGGVANIVPTDSNGITFSRSYDKVLNIVYLNPAKVNKGGFYPAGVNGTLNTSS
ncbi:ferritin-like domain-containing protein [Cryptosporangium phraense]|uniref:Ferritin-like domain-containing protein n=1 Tax=Cryptosporangium phraense TaxID=2593070 RepID=A0A545AFB8_9ACTN|nr:ferritin-like domain-containing protein [Cryptosporangium phraense]TQS39960.1 ferritin-like domain-containing protein [Cryptosporangium phraense]